MELLLEIAGYSFIVAILGAVVFVFIRLLTIALQTLTNNDD
jgi:hypothetical protein